MPSRLPASRWPRREASVYGIPQLLSFDQYFYSSSAAHWVKATDPNQADAGGTDIPPGATIAVYLPPNYAGGTVVNSGRAITVAPLFKEAGGSVVRYFGMFVPADVKFSQLNLGSGWAKDDSIFKADTLSLYNAALAKWDAYYQNAAGVWLKENTTASQSATVIPAGSAVAYMKRTAASGTGSFISLSLPYAP